VKQLWVALFALLVVVGYSISQAASGCTQTHCVHLPLLHTEGTRQATPPITFRWAVNGSTPLARSEAMAAVANNKLYIFGGYTDGTTIPKTRDAVSYDPATNRWTTLPQMPRPMTHSGIAVDGDTIYLAGGVVGSSGDSEPDKIPAIDEVWRFNVESGTWAKMPSLPEPRGAGELALIGTYLHFLGGTGEDRYVSVGDHWRLNLNGGQTWERMPNLPLPLNHISKAVFNGKIYIIGGQEGHNETLVTSPTVQIWDSVTGTWSVGAPMSHGRSHATGATLVIDGKIYLFGGQEFHRTSLATIIAYDPQTDSWAEAGNIPIARHSGVAGLIGNNVIYTTGSTNRQVFIGELVRP
jgi:N-acetylneuraminic acid mutarotase